MASAPTLRMMNERSYGTPFLGHRKARIPSSSRGSPLFPRVGGSAWSGGRAETAAVSPEVDIESEVGMVVLIGITDASMENGVVSFTDVMRYGVCKASVGYQAGTDLKSVISAWCRGGFHFCQS